MKILAIETSCDETAVAIIGFNKKSKQVKILANLVSSQIEIHKPFGGVVPNLARREHERNLVPILVSALKKSASANSKPETLNSKQTQNFNLKSLNEILGRESGLREQFIKEVLPIKSPKIDAIAVTYGPGLAPALWVGVNFAKALSYVWEKPLIPVNHMEGHIFSALINQSGKNEVKNQKSKVNPFDKLRIDAEQSRSIKNRNPQTYKLINLKLPAIALLVSGGHTELVLAKKLKNYKIVGETVDDAAGECFDKVARILDLPYPGGPEISALAAKAEKSQIFLRSHSEQANLKSKIKLPRPMINSKDFNFSFSGLKTAVLYLTRDLKDSYLLPDVKAAIAKEFQNAVVEVLVSKTMSAVEKYKAKTVILGGGVAANQALRERLDVVCQASDVGCLLPSPAITGDNALMIALAAAITGKKIKKPQALRAEANLRLS